MEGKEAEVEEKGLWVRELRYVCQSGVIRTAYCRKHIYFSLLDPRIVFYFFHTNAEAKDRDCWIITTRCATLLVCKSTHGSGERRAQRHGGLHIISCCRTQQG